MFYENARNNVILKYFISHPSFTFFSVNNVCTWPCVSERACGKSKCNCKNDAKRKDKKEINRKTSGDVSMRYIRRTDVRIHLCVAHGGSTQNNRRHRQWCTWLPQLKQQQYTYEPQHMRHMLINRSHSNSNGKARALSHGTNFYE